MTLFPVGVTLFRSGVTLRVTLAVDNRCIDLAEVLS
jgi:hypothetical protein